MAPASILRLPAALRSDLRRWAARARPAEACGLLVGRPGEQATDVVRVTLARNLRADEREDRYEVDPADHLAAWKAAEADGLEVIGAWHSHPDRPAEPSATDRAEAQEGLCYVIVAGCDGRPGELRAWRLEGDAFVELGLEA